MSSSVQAKDVGPSGVDVIIVLNRSKLTLLQLPEELRVLIYQILPTNEQKLLRLVNRQVKLEVEQNIDFSIRIDPDSFRGIQRLMNLRVDVCTVRNLPARKAKTLSFKHPGKVRRFVFDGVLLPSTCQRLLQKCGGVQALQFTNEALHYSARLQRCESLKRNLEGFKFLTSLNIQFTRKPFADPFAEDDNIKFFLTLTLPHLIVFQFYYSLWGNWLDLFLFLTRHSKTLKVLEFQVGERQDYASTLEYLGINPHASILNAIELDSLNNLELVSFWFRDEILRLNPTARALLFGILVQQRTLESVHFYSTGDMSLETFTRVVGLNHKTLVEMVVYSVRGKPVDHPAGIPLAAILPVVWPVLDMRLLSACSNLKVLALSCTLPSMSLPGHGSGCRIKLSGIGQAFTGLQLDKLHLTGFLYDDEDILELSTNLNPVIKEIVIADSRLDNLYCSLIKNFIVSCPMLKYLHVHPLPRVSQAPQSQRARHDVQELSELYNRFMNMDYVPADDLGGFEANDLTDEDRNWVNAFVHADLLLGLAVVPRKKQVA